MKLLNIFKKKPRYLIVGSQQIHDKKGELRVIEGWIFNQNTRLHIGWGVNMSTLDTSGSKYIVKKQNLASHTEE